MATAARMRERRAQWGPEERAKHAAEEEERRQRLLARGVCIECQSAPPAMRGRLCSDCREKRRAYMRSYNDRRRDERLAQGLCRVCGRLPHLEGKAQCDPCMKRQAAHNKRLRHEAKLNGICSMCLADPRAEGRILCQACLEISQLHNEKVKSSQTRKDGIDQNKRKLLLETVAAYGGSCACCGESNPLFMTIDHINNDGYLERRRGLSSASVGNQFYRQLKKQGWPKEHLQLLCFNCNMGRAFRGGREYICPHRQP